MGWSWSILYIFLYLFFDGGLSSYESTQDGVPSLRTVTIYFNVQKLVKSSQTGYPQPVFAAHGVDGFLLNGTVEDRLYTEEVSWTVTARNEEASKLLSIHFKFSTSP